MYDLSPTPSLSHILYSIYIPHLGQINTTIIFIHLIISTGTNKSYNSSALQPHAWVASSTSSPTRLARSIPKAGMTGMEGETTGGRDQWPGMEACLSLAQFLKKRSGALFLKQRKYQVFATTAVLKASFLVAAKHPIVNITMVISNIVAFSKYLEKREQSNGA